MATISLVTERRGPLGALGGVTLAGRVEGSRGAPPGKPVRHPSFGFTYLFGGAGRYRDAQHDLALGPGSLVFVFPDHPHWYGTVGNDTWNELFLVFDGPLFHTAVAAAVIDPGHPVHTLSPISSWVNRIDRFRMRPSPRSGPARDAEACDVLRLITEMRGSFASAPPSANTADWLDVSCQLLGGDLGERLGLTSVAATVGMPYETWRRRFHARSGHSPAHYRMLRRLDAAVSLLIETPLSSRDIAAALGFADEHHLIRRFKEAHGCSPRQYRDRRA